MSVIERMNRDELVQDFFQFVEDQPDDQKINHFTYDTCAFGEYLRDRQDNHVNMCDSFIVYTNVIDCEYHSSFGKILGNGYINSKIYDPSLLSEWKQLTINVSDIDTYGTLKRFINDNRDKFFQRKTVESIAE